MCVTTSPASINGTMAFAYETDLADGRGTVHTVGYLNRIRTPYATCMVLDCPGTDLRLVDGPQHTRSFMNDLTAQLPEAETNRSQPMLSGGRSSLASSRVEHYGDYDVILAQRPGDMLGLLDQVSPERRPRRTSSLERVIEFYGERRPNRSFIMACVGGDVSPHHPIVVSYKPTHPDYLAIPGLDGHDGNPPALGQPIHGRGFKVAFGINGVDLPIRPHYTDPITGQPWAPTSVTGFIDNDSWGKLPNGDYVLPVEYLRRGVNDARDSFHEMVSLFKSQPALA